MASLIYNLFFMVVTAMAIHLDASRLLLRRDHTVLHEVHDFHQFRSLTPALVGLASIPNPHLGVGINRSWLTAEMVYVAAKYNKSATRVQ